MRFDMVKLMWGPVLLIVIALGVVIFSAQGLQAYGFTWGHQVCAHARGLCDLPMHVALVSCCAAVVYYFKSSMA